MEKMVKFQATKINGDFHVGDGTVLLGPRNEKDEKGDEVGVEGDIAEIPEDVAKEGVAKKMGKIL